MRHLSMPLGQNSSGGMTYWLSGTTQFGKTPYDCVQVRPISPTVSICAMSGDTGMISIVCLPVGMGATILPWPLGYSVFTLRRSSSTGATVVA